MWISIVFLILLHFVRHCIRAIFRSHVLVEVNIRSVLENVLVVIIVRSILDDVSDILIHDVRNWNRNDRAVSVWLEYRKFISNRNFDKLRKLFQSIWCSWSVVTAMNNRRLEMIDACRWKCQRDRMIEILV